MKPAVRNGAHSRRQIYLSIYSKTTASILINGSLTESFDIDKGVKQGDNLSPLLFNIFFDSLSETNTREYRPSQTSHVCYVQLSHLMYADDLLLFAFTSDDLQLLMNIVSTHFSKWLLSINYSKSQVVIFDQDQQRYNESLMSLQFTINNNTILISHSYTYLGVLFTHNVNFKQHQSNRIESASKRLHRINWMRRRGILMNVKQSMLAYIMLVEPLFLSSAHLCQYSRSTWNEAESLQHLALCQILDTFSTSSALAIRGEIGLLTVLEEMNVKHISYHTKLIYKFKHQNIASKVMKNAIDIQQTPFSKHMSYLLSVVHFSLSHHNNLLKDVSTSSDHYNNILYTMLRNRYESNWRSDMSKSPKLRTYITIKDDLKMEMYLIHIDINEPRRLKQARAWITQLRVGSNILAIDQQRQFTQLSSSERICIACHQQVVEDEEHFVLHCEYYKPQRQQLYISTAAVTNDKIKLDSVSNKMKLKYMLGDIDSLSHSDESIQSQQYHLIKVYISDIMTIRKNLINQNQAISQSDIDIYNDDDYNRQHSSSDDTEINSSTQYYIIVIIV